jgi:hypothetical protein
VAVGEVVAFQEIVRMRRKRRAQALHLRCRAILAASVRQARTELYTAPAAERWVRMARLRKLEDLEAYAAAFG